jgi:hypothetical protein
MLSWKFYWNKLILTYPLGVTNIDLFRATKLKCPILHAISVIFANARAHTYGACHVCKKVLILCWNDYVKFRGKIRIPSASLGLLNGWRTLANKLLANCYQITVCDCKLHSFHNMLLLRHRHSNSSHIKERRTCGVGVWFFHHGVRYATGVTDTMVCGQGTLQKGGDKYESHFDVWPL